MSQQWLREHFVPNDPIFVPANSLTVKGQKDILAGTQDWDMHEVTPCSHSAIGPALPFFFVF